MTDSNDEKRMATVTAKIPQEDKEKIIEDLEYGDSISEWVRRAIKARLEEERSEEDDEREGEPVSEQS